jgi:ribosomal protein S14
LAFSELKQAMLSNKIKTLRSLAFNRANGIAKALPLPFAPPHLLVGQRPKGGVKQGKQVETANPPKFCPSISPAAFEPKRLLSNRLTNACDQKRRAGVFNTELSRQLQKSLQAYINNTTPFVLNHNLTKPMRRITITRIRNRCVLTGHPQTIGHLGISRIAFRLLANLGRIPGLCKV